MTERARTSARRSSGAAAPRKSRAPQPDRFDRFERTSRAGVHRAPAGRGAGLARVLWVLLATAVLTVIGILLIVIGPKNILFPSVDGSGVASSRPATSQVAAEVNAETSITVLNGTQRDGLGEAVSGAIRDAGWGMVEYTGNADERTTEISAVFYSDPQNEALAKGLGEKLGGVFYYLREDYAIHETQLVVLLGENYVGPGAE